MADERLSWKIYPPYFFLTVFCASVRALPWSLSSRAAVALSRLACFLDVRHRRLALRNLDIAFGDTKSNAEKKRIVRESFSNLFLTAVEFVRIPVIAKKITSIVSMPNAATIGRALDRGRGVIFLVSHFGNWEIMAHRCVAEGYKLASVGRPMKNPLIYRGIERLREFNGAVSLRKKWVAREVIEKLKNNWCVAILIDQYAGRDAPFVPFFGRPVSTSPAVALLAMKTGASVLPVFNVRQESGTHVLHVCDPVEIVNTGNRKADVWENCARFNLILENWVRRFPGHWLWMHRRWRRKKAPQEP